MYLDLLVYNYLFYLALSKRKVFRRPSGTAGTLEQFANLHKTQMLKLSTEHDVSQSHRLVQLLLNNNSAPLTSNNRANVLTNGEKKFQELLVSLSLAKHHIHIEYYIFKNDQIGRQILDILLQKSSEGVEIRVILDGLGSRKIPKQTLKEMEQAGIQVRHFFPITFSYLLKMNFRNHRKIVVVDGQIGFIGGMNIGDEYLSRNKRIGFWRDTHMKLEGECVHDLQKTFLDDWHLLTGCQLQGPNYYPASEWLGHQLIQIVKSGPAGEGQSIKELFHLAIKTAKHRVYIETPYFAPCRQTLSALKRASQKGLDVRIIVQGCTKTPLTYWAARSYFADLLKAGVKIYMYQKGILHSKVLLVDDLFATVGSANFDIRSFQWNFEANAVFYDRQLVARFEHDFWQDIRDSMRTYSHTHRRRPLSHRLKEASARLFAPLL